MTQPTAPVLLLTAWHLSRVRSMPRAFWLARRLDRDGRAAPGCVRMHRWISRRSVLLTSWWESRDAAAAWRASPTFRGLDERLRAIDGVEARVELRGGEDAGD
ncbi:MAG: antibiotic biosynthesis monooxygenase [Chloroflexota bacterium]|nr:antibiotic biosynthesis monooxygenase [Chloroflexota bacterium]